MGNTQLFINFTWNEYLEYTGDKFNGQVFYITDRNVFIFCRQANNSPVIEILYSGGVGYTEASFSDLKSNSGSLSPGMFCVRSNDSRYFSLYWYTGFDWLFVKEIGGEGVTLDELMAILEGYVTEDNLAAELKNHPLLREEHTPWGSEDYEDNSDVGNIQIQGYYEGKIDCGDWN